MLARISTVVLTILAAFWLAQEPGWEPASAFAGALLAYLALEVHGHSKKIKNTEESEHREPVALPPITVSDDVKNAKRPPSVQGCQWDEKSGAWFDSLGIGYCHRCALNGYRSPMKFTARHGYVCSACRP